MRDTCEHLRWRAVACGCEAREGGQPLRGGQPCVAGTHVAVARENARGMDACSSGGRGGGSAHAQCEGNCNRSHVTRAVGCDYSLCASRLGRSSSMIPPFNRTKGVTPPRHTHTTHHTHTHAHAHSPHTRTRARARPTCHTARRGSSRAKPADGAFGTGGRAVHAGERRRARRPQPPPRHGCAAIHAATGVQRCVGRGPESGGVRAAKPKAVDAHGCRHPPPTSAPCPHGLHHLAGPGSTRTPGRLQHAARQQRARE